MRITSVKFMLYVADMDRAVAFYTDAIGLEAKLVTPHWSELNHGDAVVALHSGREGGEFADTGLAFEVADIHTAAEEVSAGGGTIRSAPEDREGEPIWLATCADTEGNGFTLSMYKGE
jgi:predicted enzyme related to lactoylglutathione lyase